MSDENMTNNEETAALFVSAQKKKKAEEEAKKKAAEEQAKREAAEAEVRRMEQEVEERKRKAEEERIALERAEQERAQKKVDMDALKNGVAEGGKALKEAANAVKKTAEGAKSNGGAAGLFANKKLPIFIGAGVALVVVIIILAVALGGGSKSVPLDELQFDTEIVSADSAFDSAILFPGSEYSSVDEEKLDNGSILHFASDTKKKINTDVFFTPLTDKAGTVNVKGDMAFARISTVVESLKYNVSDYLNQIYGDVEIYDESAKDLSDQIDDYFYNFHFTNGSFVGSGIGVIKLNAKGEYFREFFLCTQESESLDDVDAMVAMFEAYNAEDAWKIPGANAVSANTNKQLKINEIHMGFNLSDQFEPYSSLDENDGWSVYTDGNGATVVVAYTEAQNDAQTIVSTRDAFLTTMIDSYTKQGIDRNIQLEGIEFNRRYEDEYIYGEDEFSIACHVDLADTYEGISYWERDFVMVWVDSNSGKIYYLEFLFLAPTSQKADYQKIFEGCIDSLSDI